ncbi:MAG: 4Fe-4S dicluster domain-containing protein [Candidatus Nanopelagicales bacterium]
MTTLVNPDLITDLQRFGAMQVNACFSCGNCTATCPLADNDATFPRRFIRLAQVGLEADLVASKELWTCYQCGQCTSKCPTDADPAEFMATSRRYAIAHYDRTGLARVMSTRPVLGWLVAALGVAFFSLFLLSTRGPASTESLALFEFVPYHVIHWLGIGVMAVVALASLVGAVSLARDMARKDGVRFRTLVGTAAGRAAAVRALWFSVGRESLGQRRYREDCKDDDPVEPLWRRRWIVHFVTLWGFLGLLAATTLDYGLDVLGIKETGAEVPLWYPTRLLGTVAGIALVYGVTVFMVNRVRADSSSYRVSTSTDWMFLVLLWLTGVTGFVIEVALYAPPTPAWGYAVFVVHVAIAMELLLFLPFTKFAHVMYRPIGLFFYGLAKNPVPVEERERETVA